MQSNLEPRALLGLALAGLVVVACAGCGHADPCGGARACPGATVCGLAGECGPEPSPDATRFVEVHELRAEAPAGGARDALVLREDDATELVFGPLPRGQLVSAILRLAPRPGASRRADAVTEVRRGRRSVSVHYAIGRDAPLHVDVTKLVEGSDAGDRVALTVHLRDADGATFETGSPTSADPALRPTLTVVVR